MASADSIGLKYTQYLKNCETLLIWEKFSTPMKNAFESQAKFEDWCTSIKESITLATSIKQASICTSFHCTWYEVLQPIDENQKFQLKWDFHPTSETIEGLYIGPQQLPSNSEYLEYKTKTTLQIPFDSEFEVAWGGRSVEENYHSVAPDQRFAYDFLVTKDGYTFENEGKTNEDYFCFGKKIFVPGDGVVVAAEDSIPDNEPGAMNSEKPLGNFVIIDHKNSEFSFLAHLKKTIFRSMLESNF